MCVFVCPHLYTTLCIHFRPIGPSVKRSSSQDLHRYLTTSTALSGAATALQPCDHDQSFAQHALTSVLSRYRALVLDASYRPIDVIHWQKAICLDILEKVDVLEYYEATVNSVRSSFFLPAVLRTRWYNGARSNRCKSPKVALNRRNIMMRDNFSCQYCGSDRELTLDHVIPASKGGSNSWENLVTCCSPCNGKKGNKTLKELHWKLSKIPREPNPYEFNMAIHYTITEAKGGVPPEWEGYVFTSEMKNN